MYSIQKYYNKNKQAFNDLITMASFNVKYLKMILSNVAFSANSKQSWGNH